MKKQRMSSKRIQLMICRDTVTYESAENGDFASSELVSCEVYRLDQLKELACDMASKIHYDGISSQDAGHGIDWLSSGFDCCDYFTGEESEDSMHLNYGASLDASALRDQITALVKHYLHNNHGWKEAQYSYLKAE